jgi:hypothetical protein
MGHVTGDPRRQRENLIACIESLFGPLAAARAKDAVLQSVPAS